MTKKVNAEEFRKRPRDVYEAADKGETVTINHDRYRKVFELTARDREPLKMEVTIDNKSDIPGAVFDNMDEATSEGKTLSILIDKESDDE